MLETGDIIGIIAGAITLVSIITGVIIYFKKTKLNKQDTIYKLETRLSEIRVEFDSIPNYVRMMHGDPSLDNMSRKVSLSKEEERIVKKLVELGVKESCKTFKRENDKKDKKGK